LTIGDVNMLLSVLPVHGQAELIDSAHRAARCAAAVGLLGPVR
jgi:hypothetical protein